MVVQIISNIQVFLLGIILLHGCALIRDSSDHADSSLPLYILTYRGQESVESWVRIYFLIVIATACKAVLCIVN
jgi:hypothetical protein